MKEEVITIGKDSTIIGILTKSDNFTESFSSKPIVLIFNSGLVHRVGPLRQWVDLARCLCDDGFTVFRFDLTGLGDSDMRRDRLSNDERAALDICEVMNHMEKLIGNNLFLLIGLCSGAEHGHRVAVTDNRIVGTIFIDGYGYRTKGWYYHRFFYYFNLRRWRLKFCTQYHNFLERNQVKSNHKVLQFVREFPSQEKAEIDLRQLVDRGVEMLFIYTSGVSRYYNYKGQFRDMYSQLDWKEKIQVEFYPWADHTFTQLSHREKLKEIIRKWLQRYK